MTTITSNSPPSNAASKTGWLVATLLLGLALAFSAAIADGNREDRGLHTPAEDVQAARPAPSPPQQLDALPPVSWSPTRDQLTYVLVESEEAAAPLRAFVGLHRETMLESLGESTVVVVSTMEEEHALRDLVAFANLELMTSGAWIEVLDLRSP